MEEKEKMQETLLGKTDASDSAKATSEPAKKKLPRGGYDIKTESGQDTARSTEQNIDQHIEQNAEQNTEPAGNAPLVSISCITYNHAPYLKAALDGFLSQACSFSYEILIHDDASTDGTAEIIREYAARYPNIIRPMLQTENQYSKGIHNISGTFNFPRARGKYIAMCEGDDFWCDPKKLQMQADYMEAHPECAMTCHAAKILAEDGAFHADREIRPYCGEQTLSARQVIAKRTNLPTASLVFRTEYAKRLPKWYYDCPVGDIPLHLFMLMNGTVHYFDRACSVYRTGAGGSWGASMDDADAEAARQKWERHARDMETLFAAFDADTKGRYHAAAEEAGRRTRFLVDLKCGRLEALTKVENRQFARELPALQRRLLLLQLRRPGVYAWLRRMWMKAYDFFTEVAPARKV